MKKNIWIILFVFSVLPLSVHAIPFEADVTLDYGRTGFVTASDPNTNVNVTVDFGATFTFIDSLLFSFQFNDDLFELGDELQVGYFVNPDGTRSAFGARNVSLNSMDLMSFALIGGRHSPVDLFLDGVESFTFQMLTGSVMLTDIRVVANVAENNIISVDEPDTLILLSLSLLLFVYLHKINHGKPLSFAG